MLPKLKWLYWQTYVPYFWHLHSQVWHLHCQCQSFSGTQSICCSPASVGQNIPIPNEYRMLGYFVRTLPVKSHQLLVRLQKTLMTLAIYTVNRIFFNVFTTVDQTTTKYTFQAFTSFHLTH